MSEAWALRALRWSYCAFIAWASAQVFIAGAGQHEPHARVLAGVELAAIAAFVFPPLEVIAGAVLVVVYAAASVVTVMQGEAPLRFDMPSPDVARRAVLVSRFFEVWRDDPGILPERLAEKLGPVSFAEVFDFCQNVRRRQILCQGSETLKRVVADELDLWPWD